MATHGAVEAHPLPEGISSLLDTDLYKLTMQCAVLKYFPHVRESASVRFLRDTRVADNGYTAEVTYAFTNRTAHMRLTRAAFRWLQSQIDSECCQLGGWESGMLIRRSIPELGNISLSTEELHYLKTTCTYLNPPYLYFLKDFRLRPSQHIVTSFHTVANTGSDEDIGEVHLDIKGTWVDTILYEIPLLALTSEAYFRFCDTDWTHREQVEKAHSKGAQLLQHGCLFSEFGTRRRRDYHTQDLVLQGLIHAADEGKRQGWRGTLNGTSNVHFAMKYGIPPVGTVAHEWFMGIAAITNDYENANETGLRYWVGCFGEGVSSTVPLREVKTESSHSSLGSWDCPY